MKHLITLAAMLLAGCTTQPRVSVQPVNVAVPVYCQAEIPTRPVMPTEAVSSSLPRDKFLFAFSRAAIAELILRDGYEDRLLTALKSCMKKD